MMKQPAQTARSASEWQRLRRSFAFHPTVRVTPAAGDDPPSEYQVEYRVRTLVTSDAGPGQLEYVDVCSVLIELPPGFPQAAPVLRPISLLFHPNVSNDSIHVPGGWDAINGSIADLVTRCGQLLAFQTYDAARVLNPAAITWASAYPNLIPTDPHAVLTADAGGDPSTRIGQVAPRIVEHARDRLTAMCARIADGLAAESTEIRALGVEVSDDVAPLFDHEMPPDLAEQARQLDAWARSMAAERSLWLDLRDSFAQTRALGAATHELDSARSILEAAVRATEQVIQSVPADDDPLETLQRLPAVARLDRVAIELRAAARDADERAGELRTAMGHAPQATLAPVGASGTLLHERTAADVSRATSESSAARDAANKALRETDSLLARAKAEQSALDGIVSWASFGDLLRRGNEMAQRILDLTASGVQAYFLHWSGGTRGPYQFEERVELGNVMLVVRRHDAGGINAYDARSVALLGKGAGVIRVKITDQTGAEHEVEIRPTEHIDEVRVQLEYLLNVARNLIGMLGKKGPAAATSWVAKFATSLASQTAVHEATDMYRRASHRWKALLDDLEALAPFKERLSTFHLVERHSDYVPAVIAIRAKALASLGEANQRLAFIAERSTRDVEGGRVIVPPHLAPENAKRFTQREKAEKDLAKTRKLLALISAELQTRTGDQRLRGGATIPTLQLLEFNWEKSQALEEMASDERIAARTATLDQAIRAAIG